MPINFGKNASKEKLSDQLLKWLNERVPLGDSIRIPSIEAYKPIETLGSGRFGEVCKYMNTNTMIYETVKKVKMDMFDHWTQDEDKLSNRLDNFISEFRHLHKISNDNDSIVNFLGIFSDSKNMYVMTEYLPRGSVKERIMRENITEDTAIRYLNETIDALHYLHTLTPPIVHRDIKAANLLITISDSIKLGNFGLVRDLAIDGFGIAVASEITLDFRGTLLYVAPEVLSSTLGPGNRKAYELPADIWALGCTFIEMLLKYPPHFEYFGHVNEIPKVLMGYAREDDGMDLPYSAEVLVPSSSKAVQKIVDAMLVKSPSERPNTKRLKSLITHILSRREFDSDNDDDGFSVTASTSTAGGNDEAIDKLSPLTETIPRKLGRAGSSLPIETIENGVTKREKTIDRERQREPLHIWEFLGYYLSRVLYFLTILSRSVCHLLVFLIMGVSALCIFLVLSYFLVKTFRYFISLYCECDLMSPQYLIISGILIILLFALLFSCCMVALGEYKFRMANRTLRESRFFVSRPEKSTKLFGITVFPGKESSSNKQVKTLEDEAEGMQQSLMRNHDDYYYDTP